MSRLAPTLGAKPAVLADLLPTPDGVDHSLAVEQLAAAGIVTGEHTVERTDTANETHADVDLFFADPHTIPPHPSISSSALDALLSSLREHIATGITGATLLQHAVYPYDGQAPLQGLERIRLSTTLSGLDDLLSGGWEAGDIIEVSGGKGSGKTLLVLYSLLSHLLRKTDERVLFIDAAGLFDVERCWDILRFLTGGTDDGEWEMGAIDALERLQVAKCFDVGAALRIIDEDIKKDVGGSPKLSMIIVDSVTALLDVESPWDPKGRGSSFVLSSLTETETSSLLGTSLVLDFMDQLSTVAKHGPSRITTFVRPHFLLSRSLLTASN